MTLSPGDMALYGGALLILFLTPGPVWVALIARSMAGGFQAAWPVALGVVVGDIVWPLVAIFGLTWVTSVFAGFMAVLKWVAVAIFMGLGGQLIRRADRSLGRDSRLTRPGMWAGFAAGVTVILGNPKAVLFYLGVLPGFFDMTVLTTPDIAVILALSAIVPLIGNLGFALSIDRARRLLASPRALRRLNQAAGWLLIAVGLVIAAT